MSTVSTPAEQRIIFYDVSWETYLALASETDRPGKRIAYNQGVMEIMEAAAVKSTTFRRSDEQRGFEADESFYIANEGAVRGKDHIDLSIDPPPDLVIEVDITRSSMNKFPIYGGLKVPEVWIYDGDSLVVYRYTQGGHYDEAAQSSVLPQFPLVEALRCLDKRNDASQTELIRTFLGCVRQRKQG
ncbi:MAG: Uma2 family endonuclease [Planctomycetia bacterium]|nr:Uma2 family endonuclease [Planctomycetia bacterium]